MFPRIDFRVGDVQDIQAEDDAYDWALAHDLLEHLSPSAFNRAIDELCRVTRRGVLSSPCATSPNTASSPGASITSTS
jgi:2-polyprenyl-3-methyl-5-hydroxy-6-metoxy-1,4-benzoquinol methylase